MVIVEIILKEIVDKMNKVILLFLLVLLNSCKENSTERITNLVKKWNGKEIFFPSYAYFTTLGHDTVRLDFIEKSSYSIVTYVDSIGCISCKLKLDRWTSFIQVMDSIASLNVPIYFFLHPSNTKSMINVLKQYKFNYPVCIDEKDSFNLLNHFPIDMNFQTFLLDKNKKIVAIGNPVLNPQIKELYLNIILGQSNMDKGLQTQVVMSDSVFDFGNFTYNNEQIGEISLDNIGYNPLVINDIITSCGCTTVEYSKEPVQSGRSLNIKVKYKADHPEHFDKTITIYCNATDSPFRLKISGNAE